MGIIIKWQVKIINTISLGGDLQLARNYLERKAIVINIGTVNYRCSEVNCLIITTEETPKI